MNNRKTNLLLVAVIFQLSLLLAHAGNSSDLTSVYSGAAEVIGVFGLFASTGILIWLIIVSYISSGSAD